MKILLDENVNRKLKNDLSGFETWTIAEMGWSGKKNGDLLKEILEESFDALITGDKNMEHQQNFESYPIPVIILNSKFLFYDSIRVLAPDIVHFLRSHPKSGIVKIPK